jgi:hypothetical protein
VGSGRQVRGPAGAEVQGDALERGDERVLISWGQRRADEQVSTRLGCWAEAVGTRRQGLLFTAVSAPLTADANLDEPSASINWTTSIHTHNRVTFQSQAVKRGRADRPHGGQQAP